jgi:hypothetical protein
MGQNGMPFLLRLLYNEWRLTQSLLHIIFDPDVAVTMIPRPHTHIMGHLHQNKILALEKMIVVGDFNNNVGKWWIRIVYV